MGEAKSNGQNPYTNNWSGKHNYNSQPTYNSYNQLKLPFELQLAIALQGLQMNTQLHVMPACLAVSPPQVYPPPPHSTLG